MPANPFRDRANRPLLISGFATFFLLGAVQAAYGPAFPLFRRDFGLDVDAVSVIISAQFLGAVLSIASSGYFLRVLGYKRLLTLGAAGIVAGMVGVALAPSWSLVLASAFVAGLGYGFLDVTFNISVALAFRPNAAPALNLLNAIFGVGAVAGPLLVAALEPSLVAPFMALAVIGLVVLVMVHRVKVPEPSAPSGGTRTPFAWGLVLGFVLLGFAYVSVEGGVAAWETEYMAPFIGDAAAAGLTALFWGALTVGRFLAAPVSALIRPPTLVLGSAALALVFLALAHNVPGAPYFYAGVGLAIAPIFATMVAWLTEQFPDRAEQVTPIVLAAAGLGPVLTSPLIGIAVAGSDVHVIPTALTALGGFQLLVVVVLFVATRARTRPARR